MPFLLAFWKPIAMLLAVAALAVTVHVLKHRYDEARRDEGRAEIQAEWDADKAARIALTTGIVMNATKEFSNAYDEQQKRRAILDSDFVPLQSRATAGPARDVSLSGGTGRLFDDVSRAANADRPKSAATDGGGKAATAAIPAGTEAETYDERELKLYIAKAGEAYRDATDVWLACRTREDVCRATVNKLTGGAP